MKEKKGDRKLGGRHNGCDVMMDEWLEEGDGEEEDEEEPSNYQKQNNSYWF